MRSFPALLAAAALVMVAPVAQADFFAIEVDGQAGYTWLSEIERPDNGAATELKGGTVGVHGSLKILFISLVLDYQHFFENADMLHLGVGSDFKLSLGAVEPYVRGSLGILMLYAAGKAFEPEAAEDYPATLGFQGRAGVGLDIPLGDWFALGVAVDGGIYYLDQVGYSLSVMGYFGLRI